MAEDTFCKMSTSLSRIIHPSFSRLMTCIFLNNNFKHFVKLGGRADGRAYIIQNLVFIENIYPLRYTMWLPWLLRLATGNNITEWDH